MFLIYANMLILNIYMHTHTHAVIKKKMITSL